MIDYACENFGKQTAAGGGQILNVCSNHGINGGNQHAKACQGVFSSDVRRAAAGGTDVGPAVKG